MCNQKVVIVCRLKDTKTLPSRVRTKSSDIAGENIFIFSNTQAKFLSRRTKFMNGKIHFEGDKFISNNKSIYLSRCTYTNIMRAANDFMIKNKTKNLYIGPAYTYGRKITDFQTAVTGTVEKNEFDCPFDCAKREILEEIGLFPNNLELIDTSKYKDLKVFTLVADF